MENTLQVNINVKDFKKAGIRKNAWYYIAFSIGYLGFAKAAYWIIDNKECYNLDNLKFTIDEPEKDRGIIIAYDRSGRNNKG
jgi:hypothetical protein